MSVDEYPSVFSRQKGGYFLYIASYCHVRTTDNKDVLTIYRKRGDLLNTVPTFAISQTKALFTVLISRDFKTLT